MEIVKYHRDYLPVLRQLYLDSRSATFTWQDTTVFELSDFERDTDGEQIWVAVEGSEVLGLSLIHI